MKKYPALLISLCVLAGCAGSANQGAGVTEAVPTGGLAAVSAPTAEAMPASNVPVPVAAPVAAPVPAAPESGGTPPSLVPAAAQTSTGWEDMARMLAAWVVPMQQTLRANCPQEQIPTHQP